MDDYQGYCCRDCEHCCWDNYENEHYCSLDGFEVDLDDPECADFL